MYKKLADIALKLIAQAGIKADDQSIAVAAEVRKMLRDISTGALVVGQPLADETSPETKSDPV